MSFSSMILHGLEKIGVELTKEEIEGFYHCWRVTGHLMGVDPRLVPETYEEGLALGYQILDDQKGWSKDGELLINGLVDLANDMMPIHILGDYIPVFMINFFIGDNVGDSLTFRKVPKIWNRIFRFMLRTLSWFLKIIRRPRHFLIRSRIGKMKNKFLTSLASHFNNHKKITFFIPPNLHEDWKKGADGEIIGIDHTG